MQVRSNLEHQSLTAVPSATTRAAKTPLLEHPWDEKRLCIKNFANLNKFLYVLTETGVNLVEIDAELAHFCAHKGSRYIVFLWLLRWHMTDMLSFLRQRF